VLAGIKAGAKGYLLKDVSLEQLVDAIQMPSPAAARWCSRR
jgi:DNA-binding NarL/FixJ family response regulator